MTLPGHDVRLVTVAAIANGAIAAALAYAAALWPLPSVSPGLAAYLAGMAVVGAAGLFTGWRALARIGAALDRGRWSAWASPEWAARIEDWSATPTWCRRNITTLGLGGTLLGFWSALSAVDPAAVSDVSAIGPMVASLLAGMGFALLTTIVGVAIWLWLSLNAHLIEYGRRKVMSQIRQAGRTP